MVTKKLSEKKEKRIVVDLTGPKGNAFYLLGLAKQLAKQLDYNWDKIQTDMKSRDYENLLEVFENYFGDFVTLYI